MFSQQIAVSTNKKVDAHTLNYPSLPAQLICQLHNVTMHVKDLQFWLRSNYPLQACSRSLLFVIHADIETDEIATLMVYTKLSSRGAIVTTFIICYACTSFFSSYINGGMYSRHGGKNWINSTVLTASLFPFLCFGIGFMLNTIAIFYRSLAAILFGTMVIVFITWAFVSFPLSLLGTVVGRNWSGVPNNPCQVKTIPRPIPEKKWYLTPFQCSY
ncbi:unnamed protein product [Fraxinus pennsylvanica]|uniref:Transmembrane 9 superfamily member n=1 Tax=Fraxinus pennsylvanica TaxID=56036 RepID=A0AAD2DM19_9LAMI|nr:unnamed protein product [Fraxinus pennsylvanica]